MYIRNFFVVLTIILSAAQAWAGWSIGANVGFINADQKDMNKEIDGVSAAGAKEYGNAWEFNGHVTYRMASSLALSFRPSYFMYKDEEGDSGEKYAMSGFTFFPMLKWYMLEDAAIKFYSQFGVGYGHVTGSIEYTGAEVEFSGGDIGYQAGLGAEFCFFGGSHCVNVEGSVRFLSIDRFTASSASGDFTTVTGTRITQAAEGKEVEIDDRDLSATMSGVLGMVGYTMYF